MKLPKPLKRKIHLPSGEEWSYMVGKTAVKIRTPDCAITYVVDKKTLFPGADVDFLFRLPIEPSMIKEFIMDNYVLN